MRFRAVAGGVAGILARRSVSGSTGQGKGRALYVIRIDAPQLEAELSRFQKHTLWPQFGRHFTTQGLKPRAPLRALSDWHLALALAAGQISGVVESVSGRRLLIKGDTFKDRTKSVAYETRSDGSVSEIQTFTDRFVPAINGIDFTAGEGYGEVVSIR